MTDPREMRREYLNASKEGTYAPYLYRYKGFIKDLCAPMTTLRANGIAALFSEPTPRIFENDLIAGNKYCLCSDERECVLNHAKDIVNKVGCRSFGTNSDHFAPDYRHVMSVGIPGLLSEVEASLKAHAGEEKNCETLRGMRMTLEGFRHMILNYADRAREMMAAGREDVERLRFIADNCSAIARRAPESFVEALQLMWFCHTAFVMEGRYAMALSRMDQYLYPFYEKDIASGAITRERVIELLENVFMKIDLNDVVNICVGGTSPDGKCEVNALSYCIVEAVKNCNIPGPNLSARIHPDTPDDFLLECLKSIGTGLGYPALMNDTVNIPALERFGYEHADACDFSMVGCIENLITGKQPPWSDNRFDPPRFLDYVLNNGISEFNHSAGLALGEAESITSMEQFMKNYEAQLKLGVEEYCIWIRSYNESINQRYYAEPFLSCFCHDCIGRGLDINDGGAKYPSVHGAAIMGVGTVADSLAAIEKVVFIDRAATLAEVRDALKCNFEGYEDLRQKLLAAPKYGNNDDFVDKYAVWFLDYLSGLFDKQRTRDGGYYYVLMAANTQNISSGKVTAATPDGRKQGEPLSDAGSPTYGRDHGGATVTLNSVAKPDYVKSSGGTVVNQKFSPAMFQGEKLKKLLALIKVYFKNGGQEIQMNATSRKVLMDAMEHPENYEDLVVRVSGFSAYYTKLDRSVQLDILSRTQQE